MSELLNDIPGEWMIDIDKELHPPVALLGEAGRNRSRDGGHPRKELDQRLKWLGIGHKSASLANHRLIAEANHFDERRAASTQRIEPPLNSLQSGGVSF